MRFYTCPDCGYRFSVSLQCSVCNGFYTNYKGRNRFECNTCKGIHVGWPSLHCPNCGTDCDSVVKDLPDMEKVGLFKKELVHYSMRKVIVDPNGNKS